MVAKFALTDFGLPLVLRDEATNRMSEDDFLVFCRQNRNIRIERAPDQSIELRPLCGLLTSSRRGELMRQLGNWHRDYPAGICCNSQGGFTLPDRSVRAAVAAWVSPERDATVVGPDREGFAHVCPDFVTEMVSLGDSLAELHRKLATWLANGVRLGFLIDPATETAWVYRPGAEPAEVNGFDHTLSGENVLPGFVLELRRLRR